MRGQILLFGFLSGFFGVAGTLYAFWSYWQYGIVEWTGTVALMLCMLMTSLIGFYLYRTLAAQGGVLPEDRGDAGINDGDPEIGTFSPWSWWPIVVAAAAELGFLGLALGLWLTLIGAAVFVVGIIGWMFQYYRGHHAE